MKKFDYVVLICAFLAMVITLFVFTGNNKSFSSTPIESVALINFDVAIKGVTITDTKELFKEGEKTFLTIRNVPYKDLKILKIYKQKKQIVVPTISNSAKKYITIDDPCHKNQYDYVVTLEDEAKITADGPVVGGNKIKIGIPVILEAADYKLAGVVSAVKKIEEKQK